MQKLALAAALACAATSAAGDEVDGHSGNYWMPRCIQGVHTLEGRDCFFFALGIIEISELVWRPYCPPGEATAGQKFAIVVNKLKSEPERWHRPMAALAGDALEKAFPCPGRGTDEPQK